MHKQKLEQEITEGTHTCKKRSKVLVRGLLWNFRCVLLATPPTLDSLMIPHLYPIITVFRPLGRKY